MVYVGLLNLVNYMLIKNHMEIRKRSLISSIPTEVRESKSRAISLLAIVILFIFCNVPRLVVSQLEWDLRNSMYHAERCKIEEMLSMISLLIVVSHLCLIFNSSFNVFLYYFVGGIFTMEQKNYSSNRDGSDVSIECQTEEEIMMVE